MNRIKEFYVKSLQNHQDHSLVQASIWSFRTVRDLRSVTKSSNVLTTADRSAILFRGVMAGLAWLPINLVAIPYIFAIGAEKKHRISQLHEIAPGLYLGTEQAAKSATVLKQEGITTVLSILDAPIEVPKDQITNHLWLVMEDYPDVDIAPIVEQALKFVHEAEQNNQKVLVHCQMGMSRSASIMVSLIQELWGMTPQEAIDYVENKRPVIDINYGFKKQILRSDDEEPRLNPRLLPKMDG